MVGVPGRSKGCNTCRKRKKGCDKQTPICQQCVKAGLPCEGYGRDLVWVNASQQEVPNNDATASQPAVTGTVYAAARPWSVRYAKQPHRGSQVALSEPLVQSAREQLYLGHYWSNWLPGGRAFSPEATNFGSVGWTRLIPQLGDSETTLRYVTVASAMATLATQNSDMQLRLKALQAYNRAVHELGRALQHRDSHKRDGLLVAARLMASFELLFVTSDGPQVHAWRGHSEGQQAMFLARGPLAFTTGAAHQLLADSRVNMVILGIGQRRTSPFSSHTWKTIPWTVYKKTTMDRLMDVMLEFPELLEQLGTFQTYTSRDAKEHHGEIIMLHCHEIEKDLDSWAQDLGTDIGKFDYSVAGLPLPIPKNDAEFTLVHISLIYWFNRMMLNSVMSFVLESSDPIRSEALLKRTEAFAARTAYSLPLFFEHAGGSLVNASGILCLNIMLRYYAVNEPAYRRSKEAKLLRSLFERPMMGTTIGRILERLHGGYDPLPMDGPRKEPQVIDRVSWF